MSTWIKVRSLRSNNKQTHLMKMEGHFSDFNSNITWKSSCAEPAKWTRRSFLSKMMFQLSEQLEKVPTSKLAKIFLLVCLCKVGFKSWRAKNYRCFFDHATLWSKIMHVILCTNVKNCVHKLSKLVSWSWRSFSIEKHLYCSIMEDMHRTTPQGIIILFHNEVNWKTEIIFQNLCNLIDMFEESRKCLEEEHLNVNNKKKNLEKFRLPGLLLSLKEINFWSQLFAGHAQEISIKLDAPMMLARRNDPLRVLWQGVGLQPFSVLYKLR